MPCAVGRGGDPRDAVRRWRALSAGITRWARPRGTVRRGGSRSCGRVGRRVRLSCERSGLRDAAREGEACGRATSARYIRSFACDTSAIRSGIASIILYRRLYSRRAPSPRTGVLLCRLVAAAIGATTAFHAMRIHTPRLVARARPPHKRDRESQSLLWRVHQPPAAMRIPNDSSHDEFLPT